MKTNKSGGFFLGRERTLSSATLDNRLPFGYYMHLICSLGEGKMALEEGKHLTKYLCMPYFLIPGRKVKYPLPSIPGVNRLSPDMLLPEVEEVQKRGINSIMIFECREEADEGEFLKGPYLLSQAGRSLKSRFPQLTVIADLCVCSHSQSGHCRLMRGDKFDNGKTLEALKELALSYAESGIDVLSPSAMLEGQTGAVRDTLDRNGFQEVEIMPAIKFASCLYSPARKALSSAPRLSYPKPYHLPLESRDKAIQWCRREKEEGANMLMIKPALSNLDIIYAVKTALGIPMAGFCPSGGYSLLRFGIRNCGLEERDVVIEELVSIKRAGAERIVTYYATQVAFWVRD